MIIRRKRKIIIPISKKGVNSPCISPTRGNKNSPRKKIFLSPSSKKKAGSRNASPRSPPRSPKQGNNGKNYSQGKGNNQNNLNIIKNLNKNTPNKISNIQTQNPCGNLGKEISFDKGEISTIKKSDSNTKFNQIDGPLIDLSGSNDFLKQGIPIENNPQQTFNNENGNIGNSNGNNGNPNLVPNQFSTDDLNFKVVKTNI